VSVYVFVSASASMSACVWIVRVRVCVNVRARPHVCVSEDVCVRLLEFNRQANVYMYIMYAVCVTGRCNVCCRVLQRACCSVCCRVLQRVYIYRMNVHTHIHNEKEGWASASLE